MAGRSHSIHDFVRSWVMKTLNTKPCQLPEQAQTELADIVNQAQICEDIMKFAKMAMTLQVYFKLQGEVEKLYRFPGQKVTLNIARIFTAHFGNAKLADEQIDECVSAMAYWPDPNEPNFDPDESTDRFSRKRPAMWKLMPSILDEENLKVDPDPEPRNPAERVVWETVRAYDMATKSFGAQYVKWFASEYIYILFNGKEDFAMRYFRAFLARRESEYVGKPKRPVTEAFEMCDNVHMFAKGYLAVMEKKPFTKDSYDAFHKCFVDNFGILGMLFRTAAQGARRSPVFTANETEIIACSDTEDEFSDEWYEFDGLNFNGELTFEHVKPLGEYVTKTAGGKIRRDAHTQVFRIFIQLAEDFWKTMYKKTSIEKDDIDKVNVLYSALEALPSTKVEDLAERIKVLKPKVASGVQNVATLASKSRLVAAATSNPPDTAYLQHESFRSDVAAVALSEVPELVTQGQLFAESIVGYMSEVFMNLTMEELEAGDAKLKILLANNDALLAKFNHSNQDLNMDAGVVYQLVHRGFQIFKFGTLWMSKKDNSTFTALNKAYGPTVAPRNDSPKGSQKE